MPKYPDIKVPLLGTDGNAFGILGRVEKAMRKGGIETGEIESYMNEAMAGDYHHLLATTMKWVDTDSDL